MYKSKNKILLWGYAKKLPGSYHRQVRKEYAKLMTPLKKTKVEEVSNSITQPESPSSTSSQIDVTDDDDFDCVLEDFSSDSEGEKSIDEGK